MQLDKNSKEAQKAAQRAAKPPPASGLDAFLAEVEKKKKVRRGRGCSMGRAELQGARECHGVKKACAACSGWDALARSGLHQQAPGLK